MASTHTQLLYHVIFSTKNREPWIEDSWRARVHEYLGGTVAGLEGMSLGVGGVADHIHLLVGLRATHRLSDFMRELKKNSTNWVKEEFSCKLFGWQEGYSAFTVSASSREIVQNYIAHQEEHHRTTSFRDELIAFLKRSGVHYDARYID